MNLIYENIQWIFSGIGVLIITLVVNYYFVKKKKNSNENEIYVKKTKYAKIIDNENINIINVKKSQDVLIKGNKDGKG